MNEEKKLKQCPFCGGKAELYRISSRWVVGCTTSMQKCPCRPWTGGQTSQEEAIEIWNRRAET